MSDRHHEMNNTDDEECCCFSFIKRHCKKKGCCERKDSARDPLVKTDKDERTRQNYDTFQQGSNCEAPNTQEPASVTVNNPRMAGAQETSTEQKKPEYINMQPLGLTKVDKIFKEFEKTFDGFSNCHADMQKAVKDFKTTVKSTGEFRVFVREFKQQLESQEGKTVTIKKMVPKFSKAIQKGDISEKDAATAMKSIFEAYKEMEKLPGKVLSNSMKCLEGVMSLDIRETAAEQFGGSGCDLAKIPEQIKKFRNNVKEIKKAPKIVKEFYEYATSIVTDFVEEFGDEKSKEELTNKKEKEEREMEQKNDEIKKMTDPEPPKDIKFSLLGVQNVDEVFKDVADQVNPALRLSRDLFEARKRLEKVLKAVSEFHDDPSKAFDDYLEELKKRLRRGKVHIVVSINGDHIDVEKVEGVEPQAAVDMQAGFRSVIRSGNELIQLLPDSIKKLLNLIEDASGLFTGLKDQVSIKELPSQVKALKKNITEAKKIPGDLKFLVNFVQNLVLDIRDALQTKSDKAQEAANEEEDAE